MYFDTDSIICLGSEGLPQVEKGPFLSEMKGKTAGVPIIVFVGGGPKHYSYRLETGETDCKVRGFTLDEQGRSLLNFEAMKRYILSEIHDPEEERRAIPIPVSLNFDTNRTTKKVCITDKVKRYGLVFDKRVINRSTCMSYHMVMIGLETISTFCFLCKLGKLKTTSGWWRQS